MKPEDGEIFKRFINRLEYELKELDKADRPRSEKKVTVEYADGSRRAARERFNREIPAGLGRPDVEGGDTDRLSVLKHWEQGKNSSSDSDDFSKDITSSLELVEIFAGSGLTPHYQNIYVEGKGYAYGRKGVAALHRISPKTVDAITKTAEQRLRAAAQAVKDDERGISSKD